MGGAVMAGTWKEVVGVALLDLIKAMAFQGFDVNNATMVEAGVYRG